MNIFNKKHNTKWAALFTGGFVPLTNFPAFTNYATSSSISPFINNLYTYTIGIAAILAVIEIMWGGFLWMGSGASISNKEAGRNKILMSIFGLILVLSPYLILSIINPNMLNLKLGTNIGISQKNISTQTFAVPSSGTPTGCTTLNGGPFTEKYECKNITDAKQIQCKNNLKLQIQISGCMKEDINGKCIDSIGIIAYCTTAVKSVEYYSYYHKFLKFSGVGSWNSIIPRDIPVKTIFSNKCTQDGGVVANSITYKGKSIITSKEYLSKNTCPSDSGIVFDSSQGSGVVCYEENLTCNPPKK